MATTHTAYITSYYQTIIDGIPIYSEIFEQEMVDYRLVETESRIDNLIDVFMQWTAEINKDKHLIKQNFEYLLKLADKYVFSSILNNEFIAASDNKTKFDELCEKILEKNKEIKSLKD